MKSGALVVANLRLIHVGLLVKGPRGGGGTELQQHLLSALLNALEDAIPAASVARLALLARSLYLALDLSLPAFGTSRTMSLVSNGGL